MGSSFFSLFGIKDLLDILLVATMLYYLFRTMKDSGTLNIFVGVLAFVLAWVVMYKIFDMRLIGTIMDKFIDIGLLILVILFQDQIKRFLIELGSQKGWGFIANIFKHKSTADEEKKWIMPVVYACMNMSKTKTGALIVMSHNSTLANITETGDIIDAVINRRLIENLFFKNSPLHDGALVMNPYKLVAARCTLPISENPNIPPRYGMRHRAAVGITEQTDATAIVVSEETGEIAFVKEGEIKTINSITELRLAIENSYTAS